MTESELTHVFKYWFDGSLEEMLACEKLAKFDLYHQALFHMHLALEKKIKSFYVKSKNQHAPFGHNLVYLIGKIDIDVPKIIIEELEVLTTFNLEGRYPSDKIEFQKKVNKDYFNLWHKNSKKIQTFLDAELEKLSQKSSRSSKKTK